MRVPGHPERPDRVGAILDGIAADAALARFPGSSPEAAA